MAIRVQNGAVINFGTFDAETTVTHARVTYGTDIVTTRPLTTQRTVAANGQAEFAVGEIDLVFPANELVNAGLNAILADAFDGSNAFLVDLLTAADTVVNTAGYSQQSVTNWTRMEEAD